MKGDVHDIGKNTGGVVLIRKQLRQLLIRGVTADRKIIEANKREKVDGRPEAVDWYNAFARWNGDGCCEM